MYILISCELKNTGNTVTVSYLHHSGMAVLHGMQHQWITPHKDQQMQQEIA